MADELCDHLGERGSYAKHAVTVAELLEVHERNPRYFSNPSPAENPRRASIIMVGPTVGAACLVIPYRAIQSIRCLAPGHGIRGECSP